MQASVAYVLIRHATLPRRIAVLQPTENVGELLRTAFSRGSLGRRLPRSRWWRLLRVQRPQIGQSNVVHWEHWRAVKCGGRAADVAVLCVFVHACCSSILLYRLRGRAAGIFDARCPCEGLKLKRVSRRRRGGPCALLWKSYTRASTLGGLQPRPRLPPESPSTAPGRLGGGHRGYPPRRFRVPARH